MTTTLPPQIDSQSAPRDRMNNLPAESGSPQRALELQQLVIAIKNSPDRKDRVTRKQIDRFLREVLDRLKPTEQKLISNWSGIVDIESIVAEAVSNTLFEAVKNIDKYDLDRGDVMQWIKGILNFRFLDLLRKYRERYESVSFDNPDAMVEAEVTKLSEPDPESSGSKLSRFVETDPEGNLATNHIRNYPDATLQRILLMRLNKMKWQDIAARLNISSHSTVNTFHDRKLEQLEDYFRKYLY